MKAPQVIWFILIGVQLIQHIVMHGEDMDRKYNAPIYFLSAVVSFFLLRWGGFF